MVPLEHPEVKGVLLRRQMSRGMKRGPPGSHYQAGSLEVVDQST